MGLTRQRIMGCLAALLLTAAGPVAAEQVLATVGDYPITGEALEQAVVSSPFATQFNTMDEGDQALLRGDFLKRLVAARLLYLEAKANKLDESERFRKELESYRQSALYRGYFDKLRADITIPEETLKQMRETYKGEADSLAAAKAQYRSTAYRSAREERLKALREAAGVTIHEDRIVWGAAPDTVLAEGKDFVVHAGDLDISADGGEAPGPAVIRQVLVEHIEMLLVVRAAEAEGIDISKRMAAFKEERLPALQMEQMVQTWIPEEQVVRDYYEAHPELGTVAEWRHVGQIVVDSREKAEALRARIQGGESLFELAKTESIDPYGKAHAGDMGWVKAGSGMPPIEAALDKLPDNQVSEVVESPKGFHLVMIIDRRPGKQKPYEDVRDRVSQALVAEKMVGYFDELQNRYSVVWKLPMAAPEEKP